MRWPLSLLFRGDRDAPAATDVAVGASDAPGAPALAAGAGPGPGPWPVPVASNPVIAGEPTARPAAWRGLPPVQRAVGAQPLTADALPFSRDVTGRRAPAPILQPLAHDVTADGPAGLVSGIATPLAAPASAAPLGPGPTPAAQLRPGPVDLPAGRSVQRRGRTVSTASDPPRAASAEAPPGDLPGLPAERPRRLPAVPGPSIAPALAATRVAAATAPEPVRAVAGTGGASVQRSASVAAPPAPSDESPRSAPAGAAAAPVRPDDAPAPPVQRAASAAPAAPAAELQAVQRRTLGESRRLGLGAPLASRPARRPSAPDAPDLSLARASRADAPPAIPAHKPSPGTRTAPAAAAPVPLPVLRLAGPPGAAAGTPDAAADDAVAAAGRSHEAGESAIGDVMPDAAADTASIQRAAPLVGDPGRRPALALPSPDPDADDGTGAASALPLAAALGPVVSSTTGGPGFEPAPASSAAAAGLAIDAPDGEQPMVAESQGPRSAPLAAGRALRGTGTPLRSSLAPVSDVPLPVVGRLAAGAAGAAPPAAVSRGPTPSQGRAASEARATSAGHRPAAAAPVALAGPAASGTAATGSAGIRGVRPSAAAVQRSLAAGWDPGVGRAAPAASTASQPDPPVFTRAAASRGAAAGAAWAEATTGDAAAPGAAAAPPSAAGAPPIPVARLADGGVSPAPPVLGWTPAAGFAAMSVPEGPVIQRAVAIGEMTSEVAPTQAGPAGGEGGSGAGGQDYEEIADRVYDRIRSRFANELLLDRERMGLLIDG